MNHTSNRFRTLAISLSTYGFGYVVMERNDRLIDYGHKVIAKDKNIGSLLQIAKLIVRNQPDVLVLQAAHGKFCLRGQRVKTLYKKVLVLAKEQGREVLIFSGTELRISLLGNQQGTKHEMAELMAKKFPEELASCLPAKRKAWDSQDRRMDIFDAVGLAVASQLLN